MWLSLVVVLAASYGLALAVLSACSEPNYWDGCPWVLGTTFALVPWCSFWGAWFYVERCYHRRSRHTQTDQPIPLQVLHSQDTGI